MDPFSGPEKMEKTVSHKVVLPCTRSHRKVSNNMRVALARTLNGREGANSMNLTTSCPCSKFKLMARCILDRSSGSTGRVIRRTSVLHPRRSSRCIDWAIHNRRPFLESLHTIHQRGSKSHCVGNTAVAGVRI